MSITASGRYCPAGRIVTASRRPFHTAVTLAITCLAPAPSPARGTVPGTGPCPSACVSTAGFGRQCCILISSFSCQEKKKKIGKLFDTTKLTLFLEVTLFRVTFKRQSFYPGANLSLFFFCTYLSFGQWCCAIDPACLPTPRYLVTVARWARSSATAA